MRLPSNFLARIKDLARRQSRGFGHDTSSIVGQWFFILVFTFVSVVLAVGYAVYGFSYWSSIEERVAKEEVGTANYDEGAIESILKEFTDKEKLSREILDEQFSKPQELVATTTEVMVADEISPALGE